MFTLPRKADFKKGLERFLVIVIVGNLTFSPLAMAQFDGFSADQLLNQFNQLNPQQRQNLIDRAEAGGFMDQSSQQAVTQPLTVLPREAGQSRQATQLSREERTRRADELERSVQWQRILRKAWELHRLGIDLRELDTFGEMEQRGILAEVRLLEQLEILERENRLRRAQEDDNNLRDNRQEQFPQQFPQQQFPQQQFPQQQFPQQQFPQQQSQFIPGISSLDQQRTNQQQGAIRPQEPYADTGELQRFGYNLFAGVPTTFAPATNIPVPQNYIVGPGDTVIVQLYGQQNQRYELAVSREGVLQFPQIGPLNVAGLSFDEMRNLISETVTNSLIGQQVSTTMGNLRSIQVFVLGEAYRPGVYTISSLSTVTNAIFSSGGISQAGSLRNIELRRDGELLTRIDLYDLLLTGDNSADVRLQPNDVIFIPTVGPAVSVDGQVRRPAIFELREEQTVAEVLALAGGRLPTGYAYLARLERINAEGRRTVIDLDLGTEAALNTAIRDGDLLEIDMVLDEVDAAIFVEGHVNRPGSYAWTEGRRVSDIITLNNLRAAPDLNYALLVRERQPDRRITVHQFDLGLAINNPGSEADPQLEARDRLLIFGENSLENRLDRRLMIHPLVQRLRDQAGQDGFQRVVSIRGSVSSPGEYPMVDNMSIASLLAAAGGASESANLSNSEISRMTYSREYGMYTDTMALNLNDSMTMAMRVEPMDQVNISRLSNWGRVETVTISGEVRYPGTYVIGRAETITDVIARAGGMTEYADPRATVFLREELRENERRLLQDFNDRLTRALLNQGLTRTTGLQETTVNMDVMNQLLSQIAAAEPVGRMVIDLPGLMSGTATQANIVLRDGDELLIPRSRQSVTVMGEVNVPTSHSFDSTADVMSYIQRSGGFTADADASNIFIIRASGEVVPYRQTRALFSFREDGGRLQAGDNIVVPYDADLQNPLVNWLNISTVLFNLSTTLLTIDRLRD